MSKRATSAECYPWRVNAVRSFTLNMLMLQLGMSTAACASFATGDSVGGVEQLETGALHLYACLCRFPTTQRYYVLVEKRFRAVAA